MEYTSLVYYVFMNFIARPNFAKTKRGASGGFLPRPLLLRLRHPNSEKRNQPKFCGILSPENCFRKTSSALFQISSSGFISKKVRILYNEYRIKKSRCFQRIFYAGGATELLQSHARFERQSIKFSAENFASRCPDQK